MAIRYAYIDESGEITSLTNLVTDYPVDTVSFKDYPPFCFSFVDGVLTLKQDADTLLAEHLAAVEVEEAERIAVEEAAALAKAENEIRSQRNELLAESDWTQVADAPVDAEAWATYRQALRDITEHANFPHLEEADWPVKP